MGHSAAVLMNRRGIPALAAGAVIGPTQLRHKTGGPFSITSNAPFWMGPNLPVPPPYSHIIATIPRTAYALRMTGVTKHGPQHFGQWQDGETGYLGLRFDPPAPTVYYGWAEITMTSRQSITLDGYAYDNSGAPILAGDTGEQWNTGVPEPSTLVLFALGAAGVAALRRWKAGTPANR
jgi:hypothetical protein